MARRIVERGSNLNPQEIDSGVKNSWKWEWLEKEVAGELVGLHIRKIAEKGKAYCQLCKKDLMYSHRGWKALEQHMQLKVHRDNLKLRKTNCSLSGCFGTKESNVPYGIHPMFKSLSVQQNDAKPVTPLNDRVINTEAMVLGFAADHSLPFSLVPKLIGLSKTLAKDKKVLDQLSMNRTTAAYKMRFGLGKTFQNELIEIMKTSYFSLNLDESTSNNYQKVLTILVSYYCPKLKEITVRHLKSLSFVQVNAQSLFDGIVKLFDENNIPFKNLVSMLMDSCNVMRGSKTGLEVRIRSKAPHLLDIDGDSCHHAHNACKAFCKPFEGFAEHLMSDIFNDYKWSTDQRQALEEICGILNIKYTMPQNYVPHRWLSVYDVILDLQRMLDAHTIIYFTWLSQFPSTMNDKAKYLPLTVEILHRNGVQEPARERIWEIRKIACKSDFLLSQSQKIFLRKV